MTNVERSKAVWAYKSFGGEIVHITESEILERYWISWKEYIRKKHGRELSEKLNENSCIYEWAVIHGAWKITTEQ